LQATLVEIFDAEESVYSGDTTNGDWYTVYENVSNPGVISGREAANVLEDVVAMSLRNVV